LSTVDCLALVGKPEGVALGCHQSPVDQVADGSVNVVRATGQQASKGGRVDLAFVVRRVDDFVLNLGEPHPPQGRRWTGASDPVAAGAPPRLTG
jgi:hypothetical protein